MKIKQILAFSLLAVSSAILLNSCDDKDINPAPAIDFIAEGGSITGDVTMDGDKDFTIVFQVSDNSKVATVEVTSVVDGRQSPQLDETVDAASKKITLTRKSLPRIATEVWTFVATDDKGVSTTKHITIMTSTAASGDPLTAFEMDHTNAPFKVWNIMGPKQGAFNLLDGTAQTINDPKVDKDIQDSVVDASKWEGHWTAINGTRFKKITNLAYTFANTVNTGQLDAAWNESGTEVKHMVVAKNDLYVAKLRGTNTKVLVQITDVVKTTVDNQDYVQFKFKKKS